MLREIEGPFFFSEISGLVSVVTTSVVMVRGDAVCFRQECLGVPNEGYRAGTLRGAVHLIV
jgi:hypothetical protein